LKAAQGAGFSGHLATTKTDPSFTQRPPSIRSQAGRLRTVLGSLPNNALLGLASLSKHTKALSARPCTAGAPPKGGAWSAAASRAQTPNSLGRPPPAAAPEPSARNVLPVGGRDHMLAQEFCRNSLNAPAGISHRAMRKDVPATRERVSRLQPQLHNDWGGNADSMPLG